MTNRPHTTVEKVFSREREFDDVRVPVKARMYWPDFSPTRARVGAREWLKSSVTTLLLVTSVGIGFGTVGLSGSFMSDVEASLANVLQAGIHDFTGAVSPQSHTIDIGSPATVPVTITPVLGTPDLHYRITTDTFTGSMTLCNALMGSFASPFAFSGGLPTLNGTSVVTPSFSMNVTLPDATGLNDGDQCTFDLVFRSWHALVPEATGYDDEERIAATITYAPAAPPPDEDEPIPSDFDVVLNEFLPNPDDEANEMDLGDDGDSKPFGEWIELYNKGLAPVDVLDWYMTDASGGAGNTHAVIGPANTNTGSTIIPPGGWLVVYTNKATLNNTGDEIHLFTDDDVEVDFVAYDDPSDGCTLGPTPGGDNTDDSPTGTPGNGPNADCVQNQVAPNKTYARIPDGTGPWIDPIPTPGAPNILDAESAAAIGSTSEVEPIVEPEPEPTEPIAEEPAPEVPAPEPVTEPVPDAPVEG